jgi:hypothetical protein
MTADGHASVERDDNLYRMVCVWGHDALGQRYGSLASRPVQTVHRLRDDVAMMLNHGRTVPVCSRA